MAGATVALGRPVVASRRAVWPARVAALAAGALPIVCFPQPSWSYLAWVVLVPTVLLIRAAPTRREAALRAWYAGVAFLASVHYWLLPSLGPFLFVMAAALALLWCGFGVVVWATRGSALATAVAVPAAWVLVETARSWQSLGGPWGLLAATQWHHPAQLALAAVGGSWLLSYAVVLANVAVVLAVGHRRVVGIALAAVAAAAGPVANLVLPAPDGARSLTVAVVQPGVIHNSAQRLAASERLTSSIADTHPGVVLWGESSVGVNLVNHPDDLRRLEGLSRTARADLLVDVDARAQNGSIEKVSELIGPAGVLGSYAKTRLVPFGEYVPFRAVLEAITSHTKAAAVDRSRGDGPVVLRDEAGLAFGPLTCFESAFPDLARWEADHGAKLIVYQAATSTFQGSWMPAQHASLGALRAAESGLPVVQAALTGVSAAYDARGRRLAALPTQRRAAIVVTISLARRHTPYDAVGNVVPVACGVLLVGGLLVARGARPRSRRAPGR